MEEPRHTDQGRQKQILEMIRSDLSQNETEISEARRRLSELLNDHQELRRAEAFWSRKLGEPSAIAPAPDAPNRRRPSRHSRSYPDAIKAILEGSGKGMTTREIIGELEGLAYPLPNSQAARHNAVYTAMYRNKDTFRNLGRGVWRLRGQDG